MSFYRIQDADTDTALLLDPATQWSENWGGGGDPKHGVSVCGTENGVLDYFATRAAQGIGYDADFLACMVMVEVDGPYGEDEDDDAAEGALLILPERVLSVRPLDADDIATILADVAA